MADSTAAVQEELSKAECELKDKVRLFIERTEATLEAVKVIAYARVSVQPKRDSGLARQTFKFLKPPNMTRGCCRRELVRCFRKLSSVRTFEKLRAETGKRTRSTHCEVK